MYNKFMGGVDLADNAISNYRISIKGKKWYWPHFLNILSMCVTNSWKLLKIHNKSNVTLLQHTRLIVAELITTNIKENTSRKSNFANMIISKKCVNPMISNDISHKRLRCAICHNSTVYFCKGCNTRLHPKCFGLFHN